MKQKILITAGNTWSKIDDVRVITNIFSGETGLIIAKTLAQNGFKVRLLLADTRICIKQFKHKNLKITRTLTYKSLYNKLKNLVKSKKYKILIHAAAVSDFALKSTKKGKIKSSKNIKLNLVKTKKIVDKIKKWNQKIILIKFKLESNLRKKQLIKVALKSKEQSKANLVIANSLPFIKKHKFYLIKSKKKFKKISNKNKLAKFLTQIIKAEL